MSIGNRQIGWSQEDNLLWEISKQLDRMNSILCPCPITTTSTSTSTTTTTTTVCVNCVEEPVVIGTQTWDKCNLNVTTYANGDPIPEVTDPAVWASLTTGAWCYYDNDPLNEPIYGKLYNWYAVNDPRGLAPIGKSIPTEAEWTVLIDFLGGGLIAGGKMKESGLCHWLTPNEGADNSSGFTGLPGGYREYNFGSFDGISVSGQWWSSSEYDSANAWAINLFYLISEVNMSPDFKEIGFSVRCLVDNTTTTTTTTIPLVNAPELFQDCNQPCGSTCSGFLFYYDVWMTQECIDTFPTIGCEIWYTEDRTVSFPNGTYNLGNGDCIIITGGIITDILTY
jgi:uncharacterized protein (TIGR02145 family)